MSHSPKHLAQVTTSCNICVVWCCLALLSCHVRCFGSSSCRTRNARRSKTEEGTETRFAYAGSFMQHGFSRLRKKLRHPNGSVRPSLHSIAPDFNATLVLGVGALKILPRLDKHTRLNGCQRRTCVLGVGIVVSKAFVCNSGETEKRKSATFSQAPLFILVSATIMNFDHEPRRSTERCQILTAQRCHSVC